MGKRNKRICQKPGCNSLVEYPKRYCEKHKKCEAETKYKRHKQYDTESRSDKRNNFYHSTQWKKFRKCMLERDLHLCQVCKQNNKLTQGNTVHHKIEISEPEGWNKRLDPGNVITVCATCHAKIHKTKKNIHTPPNF